MAVPSEMGLRLLLSPIASNIVVRTACCSVGIGLPVYSTFKAIESKDESEQQRWLVYWAAFGSLSIAELFTDKFISWIPLYYHAKFAFLVWLQLPSSNGAKQLYKSHLRPFFLKHQARLDQISEYFHREMSKFVSTHAAEFQFAKTALLKTLEYTNGIVNGAVNSPEPAVGSRVGRAIEGPTQDSSSDKED